MKRPSVMRPVRERFDSWMLRPFEHDEDRDISRDAQLAIDGIMALLPDNVVNWEYGPWPDTLEDALRFLLAHMEATSKSA